LPRRTAIIIGAGPAGLTAAHELCTRADIHPIVLEQSHAMGGLAQTVNYKGNRIDIGGHRFFSKSDRIVEWWLRILPLQATESSAERITYQNGTRTIPGSAQGPDPRTIDKVMLIRPRLSRIYFMRRFFDYPITLSLDMLRKLGIGKVIKIGFSYLRAVLLPRTERSLEDFFTNRFGGELYRTFFKSYTEKVWGVPCDQISAEWGAQRVKGLSVSKAFVSALKQLLGVASPSGETSLI
jgi:protoporphyrinogen oxidase